MLGGRSRRAAWTAGLALLVTLVGLALVALPPRSPQDGDDRTVATQTAGPDVTAAPSPGVAPGAAPRSPAQRPEQPVTRTAGSGGRVTAVVDGDTIEVDGRTVRLIGVDTPEEDACGFARASSAMTDLVLGQRVRLVRVPGRDDRDRYGRLLRYVDVRGTDAGLAMIRRGLADARYDSRDGYGWHPRELRYVRADARVVDVRCRDRPAGAPVVPVAPGMEGCDPSYVGVCVPPPPPDLDCSELTISRFRVAGSDPHGFDTDGDGLACEG